MAYRKFDTGTWKDKDFEKLSPIERYLFIYFWTNDLCSQAGIYEITLRRVEFDTKVPSREVEGALKVFGKMVQYTFEDEVVFVQNFFKRQCQNKDFAKGALALVFEKYPKLLKQFISINKCVFEKYKIDTKKFNNYLEPPLNPPSCPTVTVTDTVTDTVLKPSCSKSDDWLLSEFLYKKILENDSGFKKPNFETWAEHVEKLIRIDKRSIDEIQAVIEWAQNDIFWQSNILSTKKLRDKFPQLFIKMKAEKSGPQKINRPQADPDKYKNIPVTEINIDE